MGMRVMRRLWFALIPALVLTASRSDYLSIRQKFEAIENSRVKPGSRVSIGVRELNAYVAAELPAVAPSGVRAPKVELHGNNTATGRAMIDFVKLRAAGGKSTSWLLRKLLEGEREVAVTTEVRSGGGYATVYVKRVEIDGIPIEGSALDWMIRNYVVPRYPNAKIGQPFALNYGMDRLELKPGVVDVVMRR